MRAERSLSCDSKGKAFYIASQYPGVSLVSLKPGASIRSRIVAPVFIGFGGAVNQMAVCKDGVSRGSNKLILQGNFSVWSRNKPSLVITISLFYQNI